MYPSPISSMPSWAGTDLRADGISVSFGDRRVLTDVSLTAAAGQRIGIIGENGSGKTTLLRTIAGLTPPDAGTITATAPGGGTPRIGLLHQQPPLPPTASIASSRWGATPW